MHEAPLLIFSFLLQAAIGLMWFLTLGKVLYKDKKFTASAILVAAMSIIGVIASLVHLGSPFKAFNSLSNIGSSWLSNEVLFVGIFTGIAVVYALVQLKSSNRNIALSLCGAGSVIGIFSVFAMSKVYSTTSIVAWQGANTFVEFYATTLAVGALLFIALNLKELRDINKRLYGFIILAAAVIQAAVAIPHILALSANSQMIDFLSSMSNVISFKWLLILSGAGLLIWPTTQKFDASKTLTGVLYVAGAALVIGEFIGRYVFFSV